MRTLGLAVLLLEADPVVAAPATRSNRGTGKAVPQPAAEKARGLAPLRFQGRPFFVLGTFDPPEQGMVAEWLAAGCNTTLVEVWEPRLRSEERRARVLARGAWARTHEVALIYYPTAVVLGQDGAGALPPPASEVPSRIAFLRDLLALTVGERQTLGYYTLDEPENFTREAYEKDRSGLERGEWLTQRFGWIYETLRSGDPERYVLMTLGWWTCYESAAGLYDVNVPDEYPQRGPPLSADLSIAVLDAARAAQAIRRQGRTGFLYMPPCFDVIDPPYRAATLGEFRYLCYGPLTQGAQGLLAWRLRRTRPEHQRSVVYPVFRELHTLLPWLEGQVVEGRVTSSADSPSALGRLQDVLRRAKDVGSLPGCSYILRQALDGSYLLLAVNNRGEPLPVTFALTGLGATRDSAREIVRHTTTPIVSGHMAATFEPFGVRAWVIE